MNDDENATYSLASLLRATAPARTDDGADAATTPAAPAAAQVHAFADAAADAPSFTRAVAAPRSPRWQWVVLAALALLLAIQVLLADRARLAADAGWRPLLTTLCAALRCTLPSWHEPTAFTMLDREVRPDADRPGVLQVQASFRNDARWAQRWPYLQLSLSDADGRLLGSRSFSPQNYLGRPVSAQQTLAAGQAAQIEFRVREPGASVAAYTFEFR